MSVPPDHLRAALPADPLRRRRAEALLRQRAVAGLVRGREPVEHGRLIAMVATMLGVSRGMAAAAVRHAVDDGQLRLLVALPAPGDPEPDFERVLGALEASTDGLEAARREAQGGD